MKIISFSLWGNCPALVAGALANARLARQHYPDWSYRVYAGDDVPDRDVDELLGVGFDVRIRRRPTSESWAGLFWRFEPADDADVFISRDLDSRLNPREAAAVQEWLSTDFAFHSMRDHYQHTVPLLGGMWGCRRNPWVAEQLAAWGQRSNKGDDQVFLAEKLWPHIRDKCLVHDLYTVDTVVQTPTHGPWTYRPETFFGRQHVRPFPPHEPLDPLIHGEHVGARVGL